MIEDRNYAEEEVAEDLLDLIKEYEAEIKKLKERENALLKSLQASLGDDPAAQILMSIESRLIGRCAFSSSIYEPATPMKKRLHQKKLIGYSKSTLRLLRAFN